jgi:hypothetical protein
MNSHNVLYLPLLKEKPPSRLELFRSTRSFPISFEKVWCMEEFFVTLLLIALFAVLTLSAVRFFRRRLRKSFEALQGILEGGKIKGSIGGYTLEGNYRGRAARVELRLGSQRTSPSCINFIMAAKAPFELSLFRKSLASALGERTGLIRGIVKEIEGLDEHYLLSSTTEVSVREFLNAKENRESLGSLLAGKFNSVRVDHEALCVSLILRSLGTLSKELDPGHVTSLFDSLSALAARIDNYSQGMK